MRAAGSEGLSSEKVRDDIDEAFEKHMFYSCTAPFSRTLKDALF